MAITKQFFKTKPECKIKFSLGAEDAGTAETAAVLGDFNSWDPAATPMKKQKDGSFSATLTLPVGQSCKFRYLLDGERWVNDPAADGFEYCSFAGGENSVLNI